MPFEPPCFTPDFFFDNEVLNVVRGVMDDRVVADQWGCDVPLLAGVYCEGINFCFWPPLSLLYLMACGNTACITQFSQGNTAAARLNY